LLAQDYDKYEIILINDGSTDGSSSICDDYVRRVESGKWKEESLRVIHQKNGGLSAARNAGLKVANGEYICFVDSDDYWQPDVLGELMGQIERDNLDVLRFNYQNVNEKYEIFYPNKDPKRDVDFRVEVTDGETFLNERLGPACYAWQFIFRRDLIISDDSANSLTLFTEGIYFEDVDWTPRMLQRANRIASTPLIVYNYLWRTGSITLPTDSKKREKVLRDKISLLEGFKEHRKLVKDPKWFSWMTSLTTMSVLNALAGMSSSERKPYIQELNLLRLFPLTTYRARGNNRIKIILANISPILYCVLMSFRSKKINITHNT